MILSNVRTNANLSQFILCKLSCELGQIMTRYDFLWVRRVILSKVRKICFVAMETNRPMMRDGDFSII